MKPSVLGTWNVGKGRKCPYSGKDMLFMLLTVVKSGGTWEFLAALFGLQASSFENMVTRFLLKIHDQVYETFFQDEAKLRTMSNLVATGKTFQSFPAALYPADATIQQSNMPMGNYNESMYNLYGKKVEVSVSSVHDKTLFYQCNGFHGLPERQGRSKETLKQTP
ncbi:hypothetical protein H310_12458 [Aphanomyces invadans]|uniref:DDE Tnp4 domain-containing protein n=1 Tax=Aphanomyces invadans TaxID=157072 RepID=A0A024TK04_9STRA|nr:hypothetical protein H310_12458 [Aphanomyces invadans]ETV93692.1 hypothetical protein H310_12458 [Aphanomyces invadans]|eukprot:XP_008877733.1 hypothetical protein H310_12458 [Aphanomyces invadans]